MRAHKLRLIGESWQDVPHHLPQDSYLLAVGEDWKVLLGQLPRMVVYLPSGWYTILWDDDASLYDLIQVKHRIEEEHGTAVSYIHRGPRRPPTHIRGSYRSSRPRSRGSDRR